MKTEDKSFTTAIHKSKVSKCLVVNSQDKIYVDRDKLNKCASKGVIFLINMTILPSNLKSKGK